MKKLKLFILCCLLGLGLTQAQEKANAVKFNLFGAFAGNYMFGYERAFNENMSAQLAIGYITIPMSQTYNEATGDGSTSGFIFIPEFRYYFGGDAVKGFYASPLVRIRMVNKTFNDNSPASFITSTDGIDYDYTESKTSVGGGLVLGYQVVMFDALALDIFIGPQYKATSYTRDYVDPTATDDGFNSRFIDFKVDEKAGFGLRFGVNLGVCF